METEAPAYIIHPTEIPDQEIHEYANGRRVLVEVDPITKAIRFIKEL